MIRLQAHAQEYGIDLSEEMLRQFEVYRSMLVEWNGRINLTAITETHEIIVKHFLDSLLLLPQLSREGGKTLIDVGTGAGFPGIPLKIANPSLSVMLLDSLNKRVNFLKELSQALGQENEVLHARAEDAARETKLRERFDFAAARAVAALPALCEYCLPFVKQDGIFFALKGFDCEEEVATSASALRVLGAEIEEVIKLELPMDNRRSIIKIRKKSHTPPKYPRKAVKITKSPL